MTSRSRCGRFSWGNSLASLLVLAAMLGLDRPAVALHLPLRQPRDRPRPQRLPGPVPHGRRLPRHRAVLLLAHGEPDRGRHPDLRRASALWILNWAATFGGRFLEGRPQLRLLLPALRERDAGHPGHDRHHLLLQLRLLRDVPDPLRSSSPAAGDKPWTRSNSTSIRSAWACSSWPLSPSRSGPRASSSSSSCWRRRRLSVGYFVLNAGQFKQGHKRRAFLYSSNLLLMIVLVLAILVLINYHRGPPPRAPGLHREQAPQPVRPDRSR